MKKVSALVLLFAMSGMVLAAGLKSGPQEGEKLAGPFHPLNVNGSKAGTKACLYCKHGDNPVAMIFARTPDCPQTVKLIKKLEEWVAANEKAELGSFVVFLSDEDKISDKLKAMTTKEKIEKVTVAVDNPEGPKGYKVEKDADLTIVLYKEHIVKNNWAFKKGEIKDADIDAVGKGVTELVKK